VSDKTNLPSYMDGMVKKIDYHHFDGTQTIVCCILLSNGCTAIGKSDCINPSDFSAAKGKNAAYHRALDTATELVGFHQKVIFNSENN